MKKLFQYGLVLGFLFLSFPFVHAATTERISMSNEGGLGSTRASITPDGKFVAFQSAASDLILNGNGLTDIYVYSREKKTVEVVSVANDGTPGDLGSSSPSISADGRYVAFLSYAKNLVPGVNQDIQVFVHDRVTGSTERVSINSDGTPGYSVYGYPPSISADGRYVAFVSFQRLTSEDTNNYQDVYVYDRESGLTECVSVAMNGTSGNGHSGRYHGSVYGYSVSINSDGRYVAFASTASDLVANDNNKSQGGSPNDPFLFEGMDVFVRDREAGVTERVSIPTQSYDGGSSFYPSISADGRYVAFASFANSLVGINDPYGRCDVFLHDLQTGLTELVSMPYSGSYDSWRPAISPEGRYVAFSSISQFVPNDTNGSWDIFINDRETGVTERVNLASDGTQADYEPFYQNYYQFVSLSAYGRYASFDSSATNLVLGDSNGTHDVFIRDRQNDGDADGFLALDECNDSDASIYPGASELKGDGIDQDCNGYDLTIDITVNYKANKDRLTVDATSDLGSAANLALDGYGQMTYSGNKWSIIIEPAGGNPGTVTVSGIEGSETATVQ